MLLGQYIDCIRVLSYDVTAKQCC